MTVNDKRRGRISKTKKASTAEQSIESIRRSLSSALCGTFGGSEDNRDAVKRFAVYFNSQNSAACTSIRRWQLTKKQGAIA